MRSRHITRQGDAGLIDVRTMTLRECPQLPIGHIRFISRSQSSATVPRTCTGICEEPNMIQQSEFTIVETPEPSHAARYSSEPRHVSVLLVDDDDLYRDALHMNLSEGGLDVTSFAAGRT